MAEALAPVDDLSVGVLTVGLDGTVHTVNRCLADWLGTPALHWAGQPVDRLLTRGGRVLYHTYLMPTLRLHGRVQELSLTLAAPGEPLRVLAFASLTAGEPALAQVVFVPMRERLRVEAELMRVQQAADAAPVLLFEHVVEPDGRGHFPYASAGLLPLYQLHPADVYETDAPLWQRVHPEDRPMLMRERQAAARSGQLWSSRYRARAGEAAPDHPATEALTPWAWHALRAQPRREADGRTVWHGTVSDVTRQREMELAEQARDAADRANRAKSEFLARMSHELRTPLNGIIGFAQLLLREGHERLDADQRRQLGVIEAAGEQLLLLINEVLDISRIEAGRLQLELQPHAVQPLVQRALAALEPMRRAADVSVAWQGAADAVVQADAPRLGQVLSNLLSNAIKYNHRGGQVEVTTTVHEAEVAVAVRDTGPGLDATQQANLFQPFNRLGAERSGTDGTGLGLVIARGLVEAMGGRLEVQSTPGQGSCFRVVLRRGVETPVAQTPGVSRPTPPAPSAGPWAVLYAEDNPVNAWLMQEMLAPLAGVQLTGCASGAQALQAARERRPDLLLLDMHLPDMTGTELLHALRGLPGLERVCAVAVSADAMPEDIARARASGFDGYWTKPLEIEQVHAEMRALLMSR